MVTPRGDPTHLTGIDARAVHRLSSMTTLNVAAASHRERRRGVQDFHSLKQSQQVYRLSHDFISSSLLISSCNSKTLHVVLEVLTLQEASATIHFTYI